MRVRPWTWRVRRDFRWLREVVTGREPFRGRPDKVFVLGYFKTATTSVGKALEKLGYHHLSFQMDLHRRYGRTRPKRYVRLARRYDSFDDLPWNQLELLPHLMEAFPDAKFILTHRDPEAWLKSYRAYFAHSDGLSDAELLDRFNAHNNGVRELMWEAKREWLAIDIDRDLRWGHLCAFLEVPVPDAPFPRVNTQGENPHRKP